MDNRVTLGKVLPLDTPFSVYIYPTYACNFKCNYCIRSLPYEQLKKMDLCKKNMTMDILKKIVDDLKVFPSKIKAITFAGIGEPLLHPNITEMIKIIKESNVANRVEIITNASLLTHDLSDALIDAGLDRLRVSIQGITSAKYKEISGVDIDIEDIVEKLEYFCANKNHTNVYLKTVDVALDNIIEDEPKFHQMFKNACDESKIEYVVPLFNDVNYSNISKTSGKCRQGDNVVLQTNTCSIPFISIYIDSDGYVLPCCSEKYPIKYDNILNKSLSEIWNSKKRNDFLVNLLNGRNKLVKCKDCNMAIYNVSKEDYLDNYKDELIKKINERNKDEASI